jgi:hypothetical protein
MCQHSTSSSTWPKTLPMDHPNITMLAFPSLPSLPQLRPYIGLNAGNSSSHLPCGPVHRARRSVVTDCAQPPKLTPCRRPRFSPAFGRPTTIIAGILPAASVLRGVRSPCTPGASPPIARSAIHPFCNRRSAEFP